MSQASWEHAQRTTTICTKSSSFKARSTAFGHSQLVCCVLYKARRSRTSCPGLQTPRGMRTYVFSSTGVWKNATRMSWIPKTRRRAFDPVAARGFLACVVFWPRCTEELPRGSFTLTTPVGDMVVHHLIHFRFSTLQHLLTGDLNASLAVVHPALRDHVHHRFPQSSSCSSYSSPSSVMGHSTQIGNSLSNPDPSVNTRLSSIAGRPFDFGSSPSALAQSYNFSGAGGGWYVALICCYQLQWISHPHHWCFLLLPLRPRFTIPSNLRTHCCKRPKLRKVLPARELGFQESCSIS